MSTSSQIVSNACMFLTIFIPSFKACICAVDQNGATVDGEIEAI